MTVPMYRGFSTVGRDVTDTAVFDIECVKADLRNHFEIRLGEVPGRPGFGSVIKDFLAEPFDQVTREGVLAEVRRVISYDPRVRILGVDAKFDTARHSITIAAPLLYIEANVVDMFEMEFRA